ncbi:hypothetical protein ACUHMQ_18660 [Chitinimonas sp. PSY-7]|uniref:hypothetical protein n=1 Tax=Chitinimonas sp. PSY-7 TaxID=3459088 RepID=UPI00404005DE
MDTYESPMILLVIVLTGLVLAWLFRRFLTETWWYFSGKPFGRLLEDVTRWHAERQIPFSKGEIDALYERVSQAKDKSAECNMIRRELGLL